MGKKQTQVQIKKKLCLKEKGSSDLKGFPIPSVFLKRNRKNSGDVCSSSSGKRSRKGAVSQF